jgi:hypothetical protein
LCGVRTNGNGQRQTAAPKLRKFNAMLTAEDDAALGELANARGVSMAELLRQLIREESLRQNKESDHG